MIFKRLLCWELAKKYNFRKWDVLLPTGCDCILERTLLLNKIYDKDGEDIELVNKDISYILAMAIPVAGFVALGMRILWRCKVLHQYIIPLLSPEVEEWSLLLFTLIPELYYWRTWRKTKCFMHTANYEK